MKEFKFVYIIYTGPVRYYTEVHGSAHGGSPWGRTRPPPVILRPQTPYPAWLSRKALNGKRNMAKSRETWPTSRETEMLDTVRIPYATLKQSLVPTLKQS